MKCDRYVRVSKTSFIMTSILYACWNGILKDGKITTCPCVIWRGSKRIAEISSTLVVKFITRTTDLNFTEKHDYPFLMDGLYYCSSIRLYIIISRLIICVYEGRKIYRGIYEIKLYKT